MTNVVGIVAEYNPFHNGHAYHLEEAKELAKADYVIAVISGNFVQRGNVSLIDKWEKANMAIANGADLVIELPTIYSISSAENFDYGAVKFIDKIKQGVSYEDSIPRNGGCRTNPCRLLQLSHLSEGNEAGWEKHYDPVAGFA